jgi:hypothetical protein
MSDLERRLRYVYRKTDGPEELLEAADTLAEIRIALTKESTASWRRIKEALAILNRSDTDE